MHRCEMNVKNNNITFWQTKVWSTKVWESYLNWETIKKK
jgi:hypothetical protein